MTISFNLIATALLVSVIAASFTAAGITGVDPAGALKVKYSPGKYIPKDTCFIKRQTEV